MTETLRNRRIKSKNARLKSVHRLGSGNTSGRHRTEDEYR